MRTGLAPRKTDDVTLLQHMLTFGRTERRLAAEHDHPFFIQVMRVVRPEPAARLDFGHGRADQFTADAFADTHTFAAPAVAVPRHIPLVTIEVESLHSVNASNQSSLCVVLGRSVSSGDIPERWPGRGFSVQLTARSAIRARACCPRCCPRDQGETARGERSP